MHITMGNSTSLMFKDIVRMQENILPLRWLHGHKYEEAAIARRMKLLKGQDLVGWAGSLAVAS